MKAKSVIAATACLAFALTGYACGAEKPARAPETCTTTAPVTSCPAPHLSPSYLPAGVESEEGPKLIEAAEWWSTWTDGDVIVQVLGGLSADRGDDPEARTATVRGKPAQVGPVAIQTGTYPAVNWDEQSSCGLHQYAVVAKGINDEELLRVANSLEEDEGFVTDRIG